MSREITNKHQQRDCDEIYDGNGVSQLNNNRIDMGVGYLVRLQEKAYNKKDRLDGTRDEHGEGEPRVVIQL